MKMLQTLNSRSASGQNKKLDILNTLKELSEVKNS